jgi:glycosyltransferase involved in cell wall biosynthesis
MNNFEHISVLILTFNEAANIGRTLNALHNFSEVVILDSGSTDATLLIADRYPNVRICTRAFDSHGSQWNHGLADCGITRPWVLALDADYVVSPVLLDEIALLHPTSSTSGYRVAFRYCIFGKPLSGTLYPPIIALYRRTSTRYVQDGHTQRAIVDGEVKELRGRIDHDDRKPLARWLTSQLTYARLEADHLLATPQSQLRQIDKIRRMGWPAPLLVFFYTLVIKGCLLDGLPGWLYVLQRTLAEIVIAVEIVDRKLRRRESNLE